ncbi:hypothetical protein [Anaerotruncus rubiinfantis]|uniref:hypothetical protein n=1 Tax=Anaerotruncus rubiinfantis TaxID=1720200 RepID=UPI0034A318E7
MNLLNVLLLFLKLFSLHQPAGGLDAELKSRGLCSFTQTPAFSSKKHAVVEKGNILVFKVLIFGGAGPNRNRQKKIKKLPQVISNEIPSSTCPALKSIPCCLRAYRQPYAALHQVGAGTMSSRGRIGRLRSFLEPAVLN